MMASAVVLGLLGNLHCFFMCGPLVAATGLKHGKNIFLLAILYQIGRILVYGVLGFLAGSIGHGFSLIGLHQFLAIIAGSVLILFALHQLLYFPFLLPIKTTFLLQWIVQTNNKLKGKSVFVMGGLNGLLPCGLVYIALTAALVGNSPWDSTLYMLVFGLGTFPVMIGCYIFPKLNLAGNIKLNKRLTSLVVLIMGIWILSRGLGLGIAYLSPSDKALNTHQQHTEQHH